jgi:elongation factor Ts
MHTASCVCASCSGRPRTSLFADVVDQTEAADVPAPEETEAVAEVAAPVETEAVAVPAEVEALDGIESSEEAHNVERPARKTLQKKKPKGTELSELVIGSMVTGSVRSIQSYGAFVDIGAQTDGLLHISQLSAGYVASVNDVIKEGEELQVRIVSIDTAKGQVALSLMSQEEADDSEKAAKQQQNRPQRQSGGRRDDSAALSALTEKGWDPAGFVEGTVVSTVDFGCFVRIDLSLLNSECAGQLDGLVHISALRAGRVNSVTDVVSVDEKVKVRVKSITGTKVSLTMMSVEEEEAKNEERGGGGGFGGGGGGFEGAKDWKESLEKIDVDQPTFTNRIIVQDRRK